MLESSSRRFGLGLFLFMTLGAATVWGDTVTARFSGDVTFVDTSLSGAYSIGDAMDITITYDTSTPDINASINDGLFPSAITAWSARVNGLEIASSSDGNIHTRDDKPTGDDFLPNTNSALGLTGPDVNGLSVFSSLIQLRDSSAGAFSSDQLPVFFPPASVFNDDFEPTFIDVRYLEGSFARSVAARLESITVVPNVTVRFAGGVSFVHASLAGTYSIGDAMDITITYATATPDNDLRPTNGVFSSAICAWSARVNGVEIASSTDGHIQTRNDEPNGDDFIPNTNFNLGLSGPDVNGLPVFSSIIQLRDSSGGAFPSDQLPVSFPPASVFTDDAEPSFIDVRYREGSFARSVAATLESITIVPTVTVRFSGDVYLVDPALGSTYSIGDAMDITITYETSEPDIDPSPIGGLFASAITAWSARVNGTEIASSSDGGIQIRNDQPTGDDFIPVTNKAVGLTGPEVNGLPVFNSIIQLRDRSAEAFPSDRLPVYFPPASVFNDELEPTFIDVRYLEDGFARPVAARVTTIAILGANPNPTSVPELSVSRALVLHPARPNPFNPRTLILYELSRPDHARLRVFDARGRVVATLVDGWAEAGRHEVVWEPAFVASGVYYCRLEALGTLRSQALVLIK